MDQHLQTVTEIRAIMADRQERTLSQIREQCATPPSYAVLHIIIHDLVRKGEVDFRINEAGAMAYRLNPMSVDTRYPVSFFPFSW